MILEHHETYMRCCLELAEQGLGKVAPNPLVGCVIVHEEEIIGEGYHEQYGGPHAEVNAINSVKNASLLPLSTLYVNLEPCAHHGKTPPCSDLIIQHKIKRVVIGCTDTNPLVAGKGIEKLKQNGLEIVQDVLQDECRDLNKRFFTFHEKKRPYIILKWAQTKDGFISKTAPVSKEDNWITSPESKELVHAWRGQEQAIMVGTNTVLFDNPHLTVRLAEGKNPLRVVIDRNLRIAGDFNIFSNDAETIVFTEQKPLNRGKVHYEQIDFSGNVLQRIMDVLCRKKIISIIVEGGAQLLQSFIRFDLWDEARIFTGEKIFKEGLKGPVINGKEKSVISIGTDSLRRVVRE